MPNNTSIVEEPTTEPKKPAQITRPSWDEWFMTLCFFISSRSADPRTHHACILVSQENDILSQGYNSPPRNSDDTKIASNLETKGPYMVHSETNAIINAARNGTKIHGCKAYITGYPCHNCLGNLINAGCREIIYGPIESVCIDSQSKLVSKDLIEWSQIKIRCIENMNFLHNSVSGLYRYLSVKTGDKQCLDVSEALKNVLYKEKTTI